MAVGAFTAQATTRNGSTLTQRTGAPLTEAPVPGSPLRKEDTLPPHTTHRRAYVAWAQCCDQHLGVHMDHFEREHLALIGQFVDWNWDGRQWVFPKDDWAIVVALLQRLGYHVKVYPRYYELKFDVGSGIPEYEVEKQVVRALKRQS